MKRKTSASRKRSIRTIELREWSSSRNKGYCGFNHVNLLAKASARKAVVMPEFCTFKVKYVDECLAVFERIQRDLVRGERILLDFSKTISIKATFSVYFYSEIVFLHSKFGLDCLRVDIKTLNKDIRFLLGQSGILRLTNGMAMLKSHQDLHPIVQGEARNMDVDAEPIVNYVLDRAVNVGFIDKVGEEYAIYENIVDKAIREAVLNVYHHAYDDGTSRRWWCSALILRRELYVSICDKGVGIPYTLPRANLKEQLRNILPLLNDDAQMIQAAMQYTRSSHIDTTGRGKGTRDMQGFVLSKSGGEMTVLSGNGHYTLYGESKREKLFTMARPIQGTTVSWRIPLEGG